MTSKNAYNKVTILLTTKLMNGITSFISENLRKNLICLSEQYYYF